MFEYSHAEKIVMPLMFLSITIIGVLLGFLLRRKSEKIRNLPLTFIAITLIVMEIIKQTRLIILHDWDYWSLPVHFCSFFIFWCAFAQFSRGKLKQLGYSCALCGAILMTILLYINPSSIINNSCANPFKDFSLFHTFTFHFLVVSYWIWLVCLKLYKPLPSHIWKTTIIYFCYFVLIFICAYIFKTNYTNALYSNIPFMESFRLKFGQVLYTIVMFLFGSASIAALSTIIYYISKIKKKNH